MKYLSQFVLSVFLSFSLWSSGQQIDSTFGQNGFWQVREAQNSFQSPAHGEMRIQPDGKFLIADIHKRELLVQKRLAEFFTGNPCFGASLWLRQLLADGSPDSSFGSHGSIFLPLSYFSNEEAFYDIILRPEGGCFILLRGHHDLIEIYAFQADGSLDPNYGHAGIISFQLAEVKNGGWTFLSGKIKSLPNGDLLLGGSTSSGIFLCQLHKSGDLISQFGDQGISYVPTDFLSGGDDELFKGLYVDTCIYTISTVFNGLSPARSSLMKFSLKGQLDTDFKGEGVYSNYTTEYYDLSVQADGKILILDSSGIVALEATGDLFQHIYFNDFKDWPDGSSLKSIASTSAGKVLLSGASANQYVVARLMPDFEPDTSYGYLGIRRDFHLGSEVKKVRQGQMTEDGCVYLMSEKGLAKFDSTGNYAIDFGIFGTTSVYNSFLTGYWNGLVQDSLGDLWVWGNGGEDNDNFFIGHVGRDAGKPLNTGLEGLKWLHPPKGGNRGLNTIGLLNRITDFHWINDHAFLLVGRENNHGFIQKYDLFGTPDPNFRKVTQDQLFSHLTQTSS